LSKNSSGIQYEKLASILNVLGDADALRILNEAKNGFKSGKAKLKELNFTPRNYYRQLKKLNDFGIITSSQDKYTLTQLGQNLHKILLNDISTVLLSNQSFPYIMQEMGNKSELTVIDEYKKLINLLETAIDKSRIEILLATRYLDLGVIQSIVYALDRNVKLKTLTSEKIDFAAFIKLSGSLLRNIRPNLMRFSLSAGNNYRIGEVPLSFVVVDEEITIFEIPNNQFKMAFVSTDKKTVKLLSGYFTELWNQSSRLRFPTL